LIADAMGVPHEFKGPSQIPDQLRMVMPPDYPKTYPKIPYGTWSDDGALMLALADSLAQKGHFDQEDYASKIVTWYREGAYTPDRVVFDVGNTTINAINKLIAGSPADSAGSDTENSNGNGSLMRTLPLALFHRGTDDELFLDAVMASAITHAHAYSTNACGVYCVAARHILKGDARLAFGKGLALSIELPLPEPPTGTGFVLDSLSYAMEALQAECYSDAVYNAIYMGGDTDTTAAIGAPLVALRDGIEAIPAPWFKEVRGRNVAHEIIERFVTACGL
jgi:ADP-ribosyl-[dinitrogen reductase] hydrolase